jgi:cell division protein FtsX
MLRLPAETVKDRYTSDLELANLSSLTIFSALACGAALGWTGAWRAVSVHLRRLEVVSV